MSKDRSSKGDGKENPGGKPQFAVIVILGAVAILLAVTFWPRGRSVANSAPPSEPSKNTNGGSLAVAATSLADLQVVKGRWLRPDGGYMLEIRRVDDNGQLDAGYFNPDPIHVSSATVVRDGGATKVYIELNDENYPGCKYNLTYIPNKDLLVGTYYQAALQQTFDVGFERIKE